MIINIDTRENALIEIINKKKNDSFDHLQIKTEMLSLGDIIISDNSGNELIIIERKSLGDLAASIKDGRYREQSYRLDGYNIHNHSIFYLIEGDFRLYDNKKRNIPLKTIQSSLFSLNFFKGFSVHRTININETADFILQITDRLYRNETTNSYYCDISKNQNKTYSDVIKKTKKANVTVDNIGTILLSQIPKVSNATAKTIMNKYKNIKNLMNCTREDLQNLKITTRTGKQRKISKNAVNNIFTFLLD